MTRTLLIVFLLLTAALLHAKTGRKHPEPPLKPLYDSTLNRIQFPGQSVASWERLFQSFDSLLLRGDRTIRFLHLGDSHIQAGFMTETLNRGLSSILAPGCGSRGFLFPYRMAKSNTPPTYSVRFTGNWDYCRIVGKAPCTDAGLAGYVVRTADSMADLHLLLKRNCDAYNFNRLRIFYLDSARYTIQFPAMECAYSLTKAEPGEAAYTFERYIDSLWIRVVKKDSLPGKFSLYGLEVDNGDPGLVFTINGVNGADFTSFTTCPLFVSQLKSIRPDCLIISLGTNDAFAPNFDEAQFTASARQLIRLVKAARPGIPILLTTPADSYKGSRKRKSDNLTVRRVAELILKLGNTEDCAVWDLYSLLGGPGSMMTWYRSGLTARDKVHFTKAGYELQGMLLYEAILNAWYDHLDNKKR
jgi:lysophospholipase L1-like esterase